VTTSAVTLVLAGILGFFLVSRMLRPVRAITRTAREIEEHNLSRRLDVHGNDELGDLASTLNQTFARLEAAFVREREFTADASHELRTPLAIAQGEATLALREERSGEEYQKSLESISRQISRSSSLINRLLFLARSDDRLELLMTQVDLRALLTEAVGDARVLCEPKSISLQSNVAAAEGSYLVKGDMVRLRELLLNLVDNAVRYTPAEGKITVSLERDESDARISIGDNGIGIAGEHLPNIFKRFYRVDNSRSRAEGGTGLGLAISQRIAEVHGGRIEVESKVGQGSTFTVFLPLDR
jgi:heavy metal sensor kinase